MRRIGEAVSENYSSFTKGQRLLAEYITDRCDKASFMTSFELASVTGVSQSTVVRFASALGYDGYSEFQQALQEELKYRLSALERFELINDVPSDEDAVSSIAAVDSLNIKKNATPLAVEALKGLVTRLMLSSKVYVYGQGIAAAASVYISHYLKILLPNVSCVNLAGVDTLTAAAGIDSGDMLLCIGFPVHQDGTFRLMEYAKSREACIATISESDTTGIAALADVSLVCECGDMGVGGSLAPAISMCCSVVFMLARYDESSRKKIKSAEDAAHFVR